MIETKKDSRLVGPQLLTLRATTMKGNHPVVSEVTLEVEFVSDTVTQLPKH
jgi:hypothetical protein